MSRPCSNAHVTHRSILPAAFCLLWGASAAGQSLPRGVVVDDVACADAPTQHYALYLPSTYTPDRAWPVILGFDAGARGRRAVDTYQRAAEEYGYIVVGSNNSRNGPWEPILEAAAAMRADVEARFHIDPRRRYAGGMSGGAHVAMRLALTGHDIAGVMASSSAFEDGEFKDSVGFPIFGTMGTEDFDYNEVHQLEQLKSAHRVETFDGGHSWPPLELATDAVEWMELQAMTRGLRPIDRAIVDRLYAKRLARADAKPGGLTKMRELRSIADDFNGLADVAAIARRADGLGGQADVRQELAAELAEEQRERQITDALFEVVDAAAAREGNALPKLKDLVRALLRDAGAPESSAARGFARRVLAGFAAELRDIGRDDGELLELANGIRSLPR